MKKKKIRSNQTGEKKVGWEKRGREGGEGEEGEVKEEKEKGKEKGGGTMRARPKFKR